MKVLNLSGNSIDTVEKMKRTAKLINNGTNQFVVLSAATAITKHLDEIAANLFGRDIDKAHDLITKLEFQFIDFASGLLEDDFYRQQAIDYIIERLQTIWRFTKDSFTSVDEKDILSQGDLLTSALMNFYLREQRVSSVLVGAFNYMRVDPNGIPDEEYLTEQISKTLKTNSDATVFITQGGICKNCYDETAYLKPGGSDYTASLIGKAIHANEIQIWTEIPSHYKNQEKADNACFLEHLSYNEAERLFYFDIEIVHPLCLAAAQEANIPIRLLNPMKDNEKGILISNDQDDSSIKAVASKDSIMYIKFESNNTLRPYLFISKIFDTFAKYHTTPCLLASSSNDVSIATDCKGLLSSILRDLNRYAKIWVEDRMSIVSVIGNMKWQCPGMEARVMDALRDVPLRMISYGSNYTDISMVIKATDKQKALQSLQNKLF